MGDTTIEPDFVGGSAPAATSFADLDELIWIPISTATVARAHPQFDELVLDVCARDGASALPTAELVGIGGLVDAVDASAELIEIARERAGGRMPQLRLHVADAAMWETTGYDLVQCVLGLESFDDLDAETQHLIERARPGGRVAITAWAPGALEPLQEALAAALPVAADAADHDTTEAEAGNEPGDDESDDETAEDETAEVDTADIDAPRANGTDVLHSAGSLAHWLTGLGLVRVRAEAVARHVDLTDEIAWALVLGTGLRAALGDLGDDEEAVTGVRERYLAELAAREVTTTDLTTLIVVGHRPEQSA